MGKKSGKKSKSEAATAEQTATDKEQTVKPSFLAGASSGIDLTLASLFENSVCSLRCL